MGIGSLRVHRAERERAAKEAIAAPVVEAAALVAAEPSMAELEALTAPGAPPKPSIRKARQ